MSDKPHVLLVEARFYEDISDALFEGAKASLDAAGATYDRVSVPGALEIPGTIALAALSEASEDRYDGYIALGCVIRGETTHYEIVSEESARGLMQLSILEGLAIGNGILTVENEAQAWARARASELDKGGGAAKACLRMIDIRNAFGTGVLPE
ncbi:MAG: 6,7-dimethyl-8-ribityllumazine synthase [Alphaproteobacteria bacterium]|nr:6,7-dimethyl-8-ribityllumazine synthase [Alphaproteobacteria bacterium]